MILDFVLSGLTQEDLAELMRLLPDRDVAGSRTATDELYAVIDGSTDWTWSVARPAGGLYMAHDDRARTIATARTLKQLVAVMADR